MLALSIACEAHLVTGAMTLAGTRASNAKNNKRNNNKNVVNNDKIRLTLSLIDNISQFQVDKLIKRQANGHFV
jgi:hypothetical protein